MEGELQHRSGGILYHGVIDRIAYQEAEGRAVILDYKSGKVPSATDYTSEAMRDFQMPMYIFLAENRLKQEVLHAFFLGITKEDKKYIVNDKEVIPQENSRSSKTREAFEPSIQAFLQAAQEYAQQAGAEDFRKPAAVQWQDCMACPFHTICRTTFTVEE